MRAGSLLILVLCAGCHPDISGICFNFMQGCTGSSPREPHLEFIVRPSNVAEGSPITPAIEVWLYDGAGQVRATDDVTIRIDNNPGGGTLAGTTTVAAVNGVARFASLSIDKAGVGYTLRVAAAGYTSAFSTPFNVLRP